MRSISSLKYSLFFLLALSPLIGANAQEPTDGPPPGAKRPMDFRTNALRQLGLSRDQLQKIRRLNQDRNPVMDTAQTRLREANRALDESIYSDKASDADFQARLKDFQMAQAEVAKIRFLHEFGVRQILTPDQLMRFRQMRRRFEESRMPAGPNAVKATQPLPDKQRPNPVLVKQNNVKPRF